MKKFIILLATLLLFIPNSGDSQQPLLLVEVSSDGEATITQIMSAKSIVSSVSIPLISDRISNILATDERGIFLKTTQSGNSLDIATLGATGVTLSYKADITSFDSQAWNVSYTAETETVVALPPLATIVSVSSIPIDIEENAVVMPPGPVSITYTINEVSSKMFFVLEGGKNYPVEIISASNVDDFFKQSNEIRFRVSSSSTILAVVPSIVLPRPIDVSLNGGDVTFNPYYQNGTHNWIRIDPDEGGVIEIGGDVRASQVISENMANEGNDSIFLTAGIILGILAIGYVVFRKYMKIGFVRTNTSKGSNRRVKSEKRVKKNVKSRQLGIFALALLPLLLTVPSAFAQVTESNPAIENSASNANAAFILMEKITDAQDELSTLDELITSNGLNMGKGLTEYADALDQAAVLAALGDEDSLAEAAAILDGSEDTLDDIYTQLYAQIDSRQNDRFTDFVERATISIEFILDNVSLSEPVRDELIATLAILQSGDYEEILAATSEGSDLGLATLVFPDDHPGFGAAIENDGKGPSDKGLENGKGVGLGKIPPGLEKLPPGIQQRYGISTDSNLSTQSSDEIDGTNGESNGDTNDDTFVLNFFEYLPGWDKASPDNNGQGQGVGLGEKLEPRGIEKKSDEWILEHGFIADDEWEGDWTDDISDNQGKGKQCAHGVCGKAGEDHGKSNNNGQGQGSGSGGGPPEDPPGGGPPEDPPGGGPPEDPPGGGPPPGKGGGKP